jgi:hypothetical protein
LTSAVIFHWRNNAWKSSNFSHLWLECWQNTRHQKLTPIPQ